MMKGRADETWIVFRKRLVPDTEPRAGLILDWRVGGALDDDDDPASIKRVCYYAVCFLPSSYALYRPGKASEDPLFEMTVSCAASSPSGLMNVLSRKTAVPMSWLGNIISLPPSTTSTDVKHFQKFEPWIYLHQLSADHQQLCVFREAPLGPT